MLWGDLQQEDGEGGFAFPGQEIVGVPAMCWSRQLRADGGVHGAEPILGTCLESAVWGIAAGVRYACEFVTIDHGAQQR